MRFFAPVLGALWLLSLSAARPASAQQGQDHPVFIAGFTYIPGQSAVPIQGGATPAAVPLMINQGDTVTAINLDPWSALETHTLTADQVDTQNVPLFDTAFLGLSVSGAVSGVSSLGSGSYPFHCKVHPFMHGLLVVQ